jgi:peptide subunit release factor 1 (eRF1)
MTANADFLVSRTDARNFAYALSKSKHMRGFMPISPIFPPDKNMNRVIEYLRQVADILEADAKEGIGP